MGTISGFLKPHTSVRKGELQLLLFTELGFCLTFDKSSQLLVILLIRLWISFLFIYRLFFKKPTNVLQGPNLCLQIACHTYQTAPNSKYVQ